MTKLLTLKIGDTFSVVSNTLVDINNGTKIIRTVISPSKIFKIEQITSKIIKCSCLNYTNINKQFKGFIFSLEDEVELITKLS